MADLARSLEWYEKHTPMEVLERFVDDFGVGAWLADRADAAMPFVLVLSQFAPETDPFGYAPPTILGPYAHLGFELLSREAVDEIAAEARTEGHLSMEPVQMNDPIGYICFVEDPDGNIIEFSYGQGTYQIIEDKWGVVR